MAMDRRVVSTLGALGLIGLAVGTMGCTRSLELSYAPALERFDNAVLVEKIPLGVARFKDKRSWVEKGDTKSESFIAQAGAWKFGLSYKGREYVPVGDIVQDLFIQEFGRAGLTARPIEQVLGRDDRKGLVEQARRQDFQYALGGDILVFEFVNEDKFFTIDSRRSVSLAVTLLKVPSEDPVLDTVVSETDRESEGLGILHSTNLDKLMTRVFKKVVQQVAEQIAAKLAMDPRDVRVTVAFGHRPARSDRSGSLRSGGD
jgi:hypothetical protein